MEQPIIYNKKYYQIQKLLKDEDFLNLVKKFKQRFADFGCPIPKDGFSDRGGYDKWYKKLGKKYGSIITSKEYEKEKNRIIPDPTKLTWEQKEEWDKFEHDLYSHTAYGYQLDEILEQAGLDPKNMNDQQWLEDYIFLGDKEYPEDLAITKFDPIKKELWVRIFAHTTSKMLPWADIKKFQTFLPDYKGKNRLKTNVGRDEKVKELYKIITVSIKQDVYARRKARKGESVALKIKELLKNEYPELTINRINKLIGEI